MELLIIICSALLIILGIIGSFIPIIPGPITSWLGFLTLSYSNGIELSNSFLITTFIIAFAIFILDYIIPVIGTKKFGGSKYGMYGTTLGLIIGLLSPIPFGIIIGPFFGALIGELIYKNEFNRALKAAVGSFIGFITSTFLKFSVAFIFMVIYISKMFSYTGNLF